MPRRVRDSQLDSREARSKLKPRGKPYWRIVEKGVHVGYRKIKGKAGTWWARYYLGDQKYATEGLGSADDFSDADGAVVLNFWQAQDEARKRMVARARSAAGLGEPITVKQAVQKYVAERDKRESRRVGREVRSNASHRLGRHLLGRAANGKKDQAVEPAALASVEMHKLDDADLTKWREGLPEMKAATRQRLVNDLKAALNTAYQDGRKHLPPTLPATIKNGLKISAVEREEDDTGVRENQILSDAQVAALVGAAREIDQKHGWDGDLFRMVLTQAATGTRFSQAARLRVRDFQPERGRLLVPMSRKGRGGKSGATPVPIGEDVVAALRPAAAGRAAGEHLLLRWSWRQVGVGKWEKEERRSWQAAEITRPWKTIRERAGMPDVIAYALRHSSIVRGIGANLPIRLVAEMHDTSAAMIEKHYSRWIAHGLEEMAARAIVPLVPAGEDATVIPITSKAR